MKASQNSMIRDALQKGRKISALEALSEFGCFRLASRIADLRKEGLRIITKNCSENGKTFAVYYLKEEN